MKFKDAILKIACVAVLLCCFAQTALANWYDDVKPNSTWIPIEGEKFVADTFMGVPAYYNENDAYYQCNELIMRFYKEAYNLDIMTYMGTDGPVMLTKGYGFVKTKTPKKGDIVYVTAAMRGSSTDHWAIVKDYRDGYIVMFEQNAVYNGCAGFERKIKCPSDSYYIFTPVSLGEAPDPVLRDASTGKEEKPQTTQPTTTKPAETTVVTTTEPTTVKPTQPTTTRPQTTVPTTAEPTKPATTRPVTTAPTTAKPVTTKPVTTTKKPVTTVPRTELTTVDASLTVSGSDVSFTLQEPVLTQVNTTAIETTEEAVTEPVTARAKKTKKNNGENKRITLAVGACVSLIIVCAMIIFVAKSKRK